jgi:accessory gene regulator protein AgrB
MTIALAQLFMILLYVVLTYAHANTQAKMDAADAKAHYESTGTKITIGVEMGFLLLLVSASLVSLGFGWQTFLLIPIGYTLWDTTYELTYDESMDLSTSLSDKVVEISVFVICLVGLL